MESSDLIARKRRLRAQMRDLRRQLDEVGPRSRSICDRLQRIDAVRSAGYVFAYDALPGEPDLSPLLEWCRRRGIRVEQARPHRDAPLPPDAALIDVVLVPGLAFTARGDRLGQGGGWYDRLLLVLGDHSVTIGVGFAEQIVADLPCEPHDVAVDLVVTDASG